MIKGLQHGFRRLFQAAPSTAFRSFSTSPIKLTFHLPKTSFKKTVDAAKGQTILEVARKYEVPIEGACEGNCACGTCHVILEEKVASKLPKPKEDEEELLKADSRRKDNSRLGCQVKVCEHMHETTITIVA
eukprot:TRINITY_DN1455_c0_g1_i3.p2 TRINITY_DN1455_c0_g1~~TRINITY_DN1455_c0_g1_i3.p2  ORF type:complete len:131 (-),score=34.42 TRINITY_DN1455_c0_g1_i3:182-574(-)